MNCSCRRGVVFAAVAIPSFFCQGLAADRLCLAAALTAEQSWNLGTIVSSCIKVWLSLSALPQRTPIPSPVFAPRSGVQLLINSSICPRFPLFISSPRPVRRWALSWGKHASLNARNGSSGTNLCDSSLSSLTAPQLGSHAIKSAYARLLVSFDVLIAI